MIILRFFGFLSLYGRLILVIGLVVAVIFPEFAQFVKGWIPLFIAVLLFIAALRIGPAAAVGNPTEVGGAIRAVLALQLLLPCVLAIVFKLINFVEPLAVSLIIMCAASSIAGSPNLTILLGFNPAPALRLLVLGTALLPMTVLPVFWIYPPVDGLGNVLETSIKLLLLIFCASSLAFAIRHFWFKYPSKVAINALDEIAVLLMAFVVVGLMSALGPGLFNDTAMTTGTLALAFFANFGLQAATYLILGRRVTPDVRISYSVVAGNRNMALFITALPASVTDPLLLFIGCYQIPMYLTPVLMAPIYRGLSKMT